MEAIIYNMGAHSNLASKQTAAPRYPPQSFGIGVEIEFLLDPRDRAEEGRDIRSFSKSVASSYNDFLARFDANGHPNMHNAIDEAYLGTQFAEWSLDSDSTIDMPQKGRAPCMNHVPRWSLTGTQSLTSSLLGGLECISPIFRVHEGSIWRQHIEFLWRFLSTNYTVTANPTCGTHVHLSRV